MALYRCSLPACSKLVRASHASAGTVCPLCETGRLVRVKGEPSKQALIDHERAEGRRAG